MAMPADERLATGGRPLPASALRLQLELARELLLAPAPPVRTAHTGRQLTRELAARLDEAGIRYCHFKSNQHLEEALQGITDLDVLVDRRAGPKLTEILAGLGCKRFSAPPGGDYPAV